MDVSRRTRQLTVEAMMSFSSRPIRNILSVFVFAIVAANVPSAARAQIIATPNAPTAAGPRLPSQHVPQRAALPGERSELRTARTATSATIHLSTLAIVVGIVVLAILLL